MPCVELARRAAVRGKETYLTRSAQTHPKRHAPRRAAWLLGLAGLIGLTGCGSVQSRSVDHFGRNGPTSGADVAPGPAVAVRYASQVLPPPERVDSWMAVRAQAALRLVAAHPEGTFLGPVPDTLLGIPVLEVELNADGSVRNIVVLRHARIARATTQLAIDAVRRAAPYGNVSRLPKPWKFTETFLFDEHWRFKPRTLD